MKYLVWLLIVLAGLWWLRTRRDSMAGDPAQEGFDSAFVSLLLLTAGSGLLLLALRTALAMPVLLALHLGSVLALFLSMPYGKFVHSLYRGAALLKYALEKRRPKINVGGGD